MNAFKRPHRVEEFHTGMPDHERVRVQGLASDVFCNNSCLKLHQRIPGIHHQCTTTTTTITLNTLTTITTIIAIKDSVGVNHHHHHGCVEDPPMTCVEHL